MAEHSQPVLQHDTILLSHANPEDNEFTLWLATQSANEGYRVWCDLTKLLGGEVFWDNIEDAIRITAIKVLFILSRTSNVKDGPLRELHLAQGIARKERLKDFVIPLHIDDLPHGDVTIELTRIDSVAFDHSWGAGLVGLLSKLEEDGVPKDPAFNRTAVNEWWKTKYSAQQGLSAEPEDYLSNWFPVLNLPTHVFFHFLTRKNIGKIEVHGNLPYPAVQDGASLITFAEASDFEGMLGPEIYIAEASKPVELAGLMEKTDFGKHLFQLLRQAWEQMLRERNLPVYEMANKTACFYFVKDRVPNDKVSFTGVDKTRTYRAMVGFSTRTNPTTGISVKRYWHFALQARPLVHPTLPLAYIFKCHVLFTNDGSTIWKSKKRLAAARRSQCKGWWNDVWRDRTLAVATYLCDGGDAIHLRLGSDKSMSIPSTPLLFESPVSYIDPQMLRFTEEQDVIEDYGRDSDEEDVFEDSADGNE